MAGQRPSHVLDAHRTRGLPHHLLRAPTRGSALAC